MINWTEYYRPKNMSDVISHKNIISILQNNVKNNYLPHMLFYGPSGTGKTSTILACANELYGDDYDFMVLEINASEERGIDIVRNKIKSFLISKYKCKVKFKLIILDEADSLTQDAQGILRLIIEEYTSAARFCLICNFIRNINTAIISRCTLFKFNFIKNHEMQYYIDKITVDRYIAIDKTGKDFLLKYADGDIRKLLNILQSLQNCLITKKTITDLLHMPDDLQIKHIFEILTQTSKFATKYFKILNIVKNNNYSLLEVIHDLVNYMISIKYNAQYALHIFIKLGKIENNLLNNPNEQIQLGAIVAAFIMKN